MVGADWELKEDLYKPDLWPDGIGYRKFDFERYHRYMRSNGNFH